MSHSAAHLVEPIVFVLLDVSCVAKELEIENLQSADVLTDMSIDYRHSVGAYTSI